MPDASVVPLATGAKFRWRAVRASSITGCGEVTPATTPEIVVDWPSSIGFADELIDTFGFCFCEIS